MKKKLNVVMACLACVGVFACSALSVQAVGPGFCGTHTIYETSIDPVPTGVYNFTPFGHYAQYGVRHSCLKCGWIEYVDTYFQFDGDHYYSNVHYEGDCNAHNSSNEHEGCNCEGHKYYCITEGCPYFDYEVGPCNTDSCPH